MKNTIRLLSLLLLTGLAFMPWTAPTALAQAFTGCANPADQTALPEAECDALVALYTSTDGANWADNTGWLATNTPCAWFGVVCVSGSVRNIILRNNNLSGPLPPELGDLSAMGGELTLNSNQLSGPIPPELGALVNLQTLNLDSNSLTGSIPPELGNMSRLRNLWLSRNNLDGSIPPELGNLTNLGGLFLFNNNLNGSIPPELGKLSRLVFLNLSRNSLTGPIPDELGSLTLIGFFLQENSLSGIVPLSVAQAGSNARACTFTGNDLCMPDTPDYQAIGDPICGIPLTSTCATNAPPVADAGADQTAECVGPQGADVTLDGSGSSDPDGDPLTFSWTDAGGAVLATEAAPTVTLPLGVHTLTLTVDDGNGGTDADDVTITVEDTTEPTITVAANPLVLWPPDHAYHLIGITSFVMSASDVCDGGLSTSDVTISTVTSDEPEDAASGGDGKTLNDMVIGADCRSAELRAERLGSSNGRVYTLHVAATDASGNTGTASFQVHTPHNEKDTAVDDGPAYGVACGAGKHGLTTAEGEPESPEAFALEGNYPNPFNPVTTIRFAVPEAAAVRLAVYDLLGREVKVLVAGQVAAGRHAVAFDATSLPSGTYLYRLTTPEGAFVERMVLLK